MAFKRRFIGIQQKYIYAIALFVSVFVVIQVGYRNQSSLQVALEDVIFYLTNYLVWAALIEVINFQIFHFRLKKSSSEYLKLIPNLFLIIAFHLLVTNFIYYGYQVISQQLAINEIVENFKPYILKSIFSRIVDLGIIIILLQIFENYRRVQEQKMKVSKLENELTLAKLQALRYQLNPHFLFNALHTLNSLIGFDDEKAQNMVIKITKLLRQVLKDDSSGMIALSDELTYTETYLEIEQERFHDRLSIHFDISDEAKTFKVPALFLQPLLENSFKHGISLMEEPSEIDLKITLTDAGLNLVLRNSIPKKKTLSIVSNGVGLSNLKKRLQEIYGNNYTLEVKEEVDYFTVSISFQKHD